MELKMISLKKIVTNPLQPRQEFDREKLQELANSIKEGELLQPIVVRKGNSKTTEGDMVVNSPHYEIVCGERRYKAFQILKEPKIPAIVRKIKDDTDALEKSLIENLQRDDLTSIERENAVGALWDSKRYKTHRELANKLGLTEGYVSGILKAKEDRKRIDAASTISTRVLQSTVGLKDEPRKKILEQVTEGKIQEDNVRDVVRKVKEFPEPEQQVEILDLYEQRQDEDNETFDNIVDKYREIAQKERPPEIDVELEPSELRFNSIKSKCNELLWITPANINIIKNEKFRLQTIDILRKTQNHINKLLIALGETEVLDG